MKHSGAWLYKISNEVDGYSFRVTKIALPAELLEDHVQLEGS
jgi:hypothetical protein